MKTFLNWVMSVVAVAAIAGLALVAYVRIFKSSPDSKRAVEPHSPKTHALEDVMRGLRNVKSLAVKSGREEANKQFVPVFNEFLQRQQDFLPDDTDRRLLSHSRPTSLDELPQFEVVRRLARAWPNDKYSLPDAKGLVVSTSVPDFPSVDTELTRAAKNGNISSLHGRAQLAGEALQTLKSMKWPFAELTIDAPGSDIAESISAASQVSDHYAPPSWFPLFSAWECEALAERQKMAKLHSWKELLPRKRFESMYNEQGKIDLTAGIDKNALQRIRETIAAEREQVIAAVRAPESTSSKLHEQFANNEGRRKAESELESMYDSLIKFVDSFSTDWPPPGQPETASIQHFAPSPNIPLIASRLQPRYR